MSQSSKTIEAKSQASVLSVGNEQLYTSTVCLVSSCLCWKEEMDITVFLCLVAIMDKNEIQSLSSALLEGRKESVWEMCGKSL